MLSGMAVAFFLAAGLAGGAEPAAPAPVPNAPVALVIQTEAGDLEIELYPEKAPGTVANFLKYVDGKFFEGGSFYRTVKPDNQPNSPAKIEVIQGGANPEKESFAAIPLERTRDTGLSHKDGTLSMARAEPDSATSEFFVCLGDQPALDFGGARNPDGQGFAAFGRVTKGMEVARKIQLSQAAEQKLTPAVKILKVERK